MSEPGQRLRPDEEERLLRSYQDLKELATNCQIPSVRAAARAALAQLHTALSGQGLVHEFYSSDWTDEPSGPSGARE
jgi:hypothetical protein